MYSRILHCEAEKEQGRKVQLRCLRGARFVHDKGRKMTDIKEALERIISTCLSTRSRFKMKT